jgi:mono/diheme cytochrome c family protein
MRRIPALALFIAIATLQGCGSVSSGASRELTVPERAMADAKRGELLYDTACAACHTEQAHWRDERLVRDWGTLVYQVGRWQHNSGQGWGPAEVEDVAAYLNRRLYRLPCPIAGCAADKTGALSGF